MSNDRFHDADDPGGDGTLSPTKPPPLPPVPDAPERAEVERWLEERVAPILAVDRGTIAVSSYDRSTRRITLVYCGACAGCPGLEVTHGEVVVPLMRRAFPGIDVIVARIEGEGD